MGQVALAGFFPPRTANLAASRTDFDHLAWMTSRRELAARRSPAACAITTGTPGYLLTISLAVRCPLLFLPLADFDTVPPLLASPLPIKGPVPQSYSIRAASNSMTPARNRNHSRSLRALTLARSVVL